MHRFVSFPSLAAAWASLFLFMLMDDRSGTAHGNILEMSYAPNTFNINPSGTYTISAVLEPGMALLTGLGLSFMSLRARHD